MHNKYHTLSEYSIYLHVVCFAHSIIAIFGYSHTLVLCSVMLIYSSFYVVQYFSHLFIIRVPFKFTEHLYSLTQTII